MAIYVLVLGLLVTATSVWVARVLDERNEHDLLTTETKQAALAISGAVLSVKDPLETVLHVEEATGGDPVRFRQFAQRLVGPAAPFVSMALWDVKGGTPRVTGVAGVPSELDATSSRARAFIEHAASSPTFVVTSPGGPVDRVAYAISDVAHPGLVVYAERAIPPSKVVPIQLDAPFSNLRFATYLGTSTAPGALATTNVPTSELPLDGDTAREQIPFGDTSITLVAAARTHLGGSLGRWLPLVFLIGGLLITALAVLATRKLETARRTAEVDRATIEHLYRAQDTLLSQQRSIAETLQRALLPAFNPEIPHVVIASRYLPGVRGVEIGGDWYSVIRLDDDRFGFVVGDVSGRGVSAAAVMARMRFTLRAYLAEGHPPDRALTLATRQLSVSVDGHFATVLVGVADVSDRSLVVASAGHFSPLVIDGEGAHYPPIVIGPPLGVEATWTYRASSLLMPEGSTLLAFTDGLIERRTEVIDEGLHRLAKIGTSHAGSPEALLDVLVAELGQDSDDDIALLAFQWLHAAGPDVVDASSP
jgi:serine phosphatase RsbU (regulator of sigma subunit)